MQYKLVFSRSYEANLAKITKRNLQLKLRLLKIHELLSLDPHHPTLKTHKVDALKFGDAWSSSVNGDIRIIWKYDENERLIILVLNIGSHSGKSKVYK